MARNGNPLYRKTEAGVAEVSARRAGLDLRTRALLIQCNGEVDLTALAARSGALDALAQLQALGLISAARPAAAPAPEPTPPAPPSILPDAHRAAVQRRALAVLERLWGPGGGDEMLALRQARDAAAFERALRDVHEAIAAYQGRKRADLLLRQIREER